MTRQEIIVEIITERTKQDKKWGVQNHKPIEWIAILTEEVGEASKEALDYYFKNPMGSGDGITICEPSLQKQTERLKWYRQEMIQVAAVALAMIESVDRNELNNI